MLTKKGKVTLHTGISKDSVIILVGEPDKISSHSSGSNIIENIGYKVKNEDFTDLNFEFKNGVLVSFVQN